jgi:YfiH family protein
MSWFSRDFQDFKIYQCQELNNSTLTQAISVRTNGNMALHTGDHPEQVIKRRETFLKFLGLNLEDLVAGGQVHGTEVKVVGRIHAGGGARSFLSAIPNTDALITRERGIILSSFTADCLPIFIYDQSTPAIGMVHAGWRGTINQIVKVTIEKMVDQFKTNPGDCWAAFGPAICQKCFQVDQTLAQQFGEIYPEVVSTNETGYFVNLMMFNTLEFLRLGLTIDHIIEPGLCTSCRTGEFFSFRAEGGTNGRMMSVITLNNL